MVKNDTILKIGGGLVVIVLAMVVFFPGLLESIGAALTPGLDSCEDAPYSSDCFCPEGDRKVFVPWNGLDKWSCETLAELIIDPESPTFESDALSFTEAYLVRHCGFEGANICTDLSCGEPCGLGISGPNFPNNKCKTAAFGFIASGAREVNIECVVINEWSTPQGIMTHEQALAAFGNTANNDIRPASGVLPWRMNFFVESETSLPQALEVMAQSNYCVNPAQTLSCGTQSLCDFQNAQVPGVCTPALPIEIVPGDFGGLSIISGFGNTSPSGLGSGFSSPVK